MMEDGMRKYSILLTDDELNYDVDRYRIFKAFFENDWKDYYINYVKNSLGLEPNDEIMSQILRDYEDVPYSFDVTYVDKVCDESFIELLERKKFDAIFLDVTYDQGPNPTDIKDVLSKIERKLRYKMPPLFVYTGHIEKKSIQLANDAFLEVFGDRTPTQFQQFQDICDWCARTTNVHKGKRNFSKIIAERKKIYRAISKARGVTTCETFNEDSVSILHLSDLQFGDPHTALAINGIANNIERELKKDGNIDLLVITGDIAMRGISDEFEQAKRFINQLRDKLWPDADDQEKKDRTIIIPGNHDFDLRLAIADYFKVSFEKEVDNKGGRRLDFADISKQIGEKTKRGNGGTALGLQAFRRFAFEVTGRERFLYDSLDYIDHRFENWGIDFICLNSVGGITAEHANRVYLESDADKLGTKEQEVFPIILSHHTLLCNAPGEIPEEDEELFKKTLLGYITSYDSKIVLGGHRHKSDNCEKELKNADRFRILEAASLRVKGDNQEYIRGLSKYVLKKKDNKFTEIEEKLFMFSDDDTSLETVTNTYNIPD
jgi:hypothetical protein